MARPTVSSVALAFALGSVLLLRPAAADPQKCQGAIAKSLLKAGKTYAKIQAKCLAYLNIGGVPSCPPPGNTKIDAANQKAIAIIGTYCTMQDLADLGFPSDCAFETGVTGIEGQCAAKPVTTPGEFAQCLLCWKTAELAELVATLFASQAVGVCGGSLDESSPVCSDLDCTTPLPDQRNLGDNDENDCQTRIGRAGVNYLLRRLKLLEKCALHGINRTDCLSTFSDTFATFEQNKDAAITAKCGNRDPVPSPPFCCQCGTGDACIAVASRDDCQNTTGCQVKDGFTCNTTTNKCESVPGHKAITWWGYCPESDTCPGTPLSSLNDLIACVDTAADAIADELVCLEFRSPPGAWPCPAGNEAP